MSDIDLPIFDTNTVSQRAGQLGQVFHYRISKEKHNPQANTKVIQKGQVFHYHINRSFVANEKPTPRVMLEKTPS